MCACAPTYDKDNLKNQLNRADEFRRNNDQIVYLIFSIFMAANAILVGALFQNNSNLIITSLQWRIITIFGVCLSLIWFVLQYRAICFLIFHEKWTCNLEKELAICFSVYDEFRLCKDSKIYEKYIKGIPIKPVMRLVPMVTTFFWIFLLGYSFGYEYYPKKGLIIGIMIVWIIFGLIPGFFWIMRFVPLRSKKSMQIHVDEELPDKSQEKESFFPYLIWENRENNEENDGH